jgi:hypothetical protein
MRSNGAKLRKYTNCLHESAKQWGGISVAGEDKLTFRKQKVLNSFTNAEASSDSKEDGHNAVAPVIFGTASGGKTTVRPLKVPSQPNVPPYTTWIYLDRYFSLFLIPCRKTIFCVLMTCASRIRQTEGD